MNKHLTVSIILLLVLLADLVMLFQTIGVLNTSDYSANDGGILFLLALQSGVALTFSAMSFYLFYRFLLKAGS